MATHSSVLAWKIPWTEEAGGLSPWGCRVSHDAETEHVRTVRVVNGPDETIYVRHLTAGPGA